MVTSNFPPIEDWDHYLPQEEWDRVVEEADRILQERLEDETEVGGADGLPPGVTPKRYSVPDTHGKNSGTAKAQLHVIHSAECPLRVGFAQSLTAWGNGGYQPRASWQKFVDPATVVTWIANNRAAWHAAPANRISIGYEQAGYASYARSTWLSLDGLRQMDLLAQEIVRNGIPASGLRWLSDAQVKSAIRGDTSIHGLCTHAQVVKAGRELGHTLAARTDPGSGYPKDILLDWVKYYHSGGKTKPPAPAEEAKVLALLLVKGSKGAQVTLLQKMLNGLMNAKLEVDGSFGPKTSTAVIAYQKARKLQVDGRVGPQTRAALNSEWEKHNTTPKDWLEMATEKQVEEMFRKVLREEVTQNQKFWRDLFTGPFGAFFKDVSQDDLGENPTTPRVALGRTVETAGIYAKMSADIETPDTPK